MAHLSDSARRVILKDCTAKADAAKQAAHERIEAVKAISATLDTFHRQRAELLDCDRRARDSLHALMQPLVGSGRWLTDSMLNSGPLHIGLFDAIAETVAMHAGQGPSPLSMARQRADVTAAAIDRELQHLSMENNNG